MVSYFFCTGSGCGKPVDEFEKEYRLAEKDEHQLCRKCRKAKDESRSQHGVHDVQEHPKK